MVLLSSYKVWPFQESNLFIELQIFFFDQLKRISPSLDFGDANIALYKLQLSKITLKVLKLLAIWNFICKDESDFLECEQALENSVHFCGFSYSFVLI